MVLEVDGIFDDCQVLVKKVFLDFEFNINIWLSLVNFINIVCLIFQLFYYFEVFKQLFKEGDLVVFCVLSGNFGNLIVGFLVQKMGLLIYYFIVVINKNDVVLVYLDSGKYFFCVFECILFNVMDVGNLFNFV